MSISLYVVGQGILNSKVQLIISGSLPGAIHVPAGRDHHKLGSKSATYVVFCKQGDLAFAASKRFTAAGFNNVYWIDNAGYAEILEAFYR